MTIGKRDFDKEAAAWDEQPGRIKLAGEIAAAIEERVQLSIAMNVLDFGCGTGLLTLRLAPLVGSITGVDSSKGMIEVLRAKIAGQNAENVSALFMDLDAGDTLTRSYDMIVSSMTFHHVEKIAPLLEQFQRCLVPGGHLCIADLDLDQGEFHKDGKGVFHSGFDRKALGRDLEQAGFLNVMCATAAEVVRPASGGEMRRFPVFLMSALSQGRRSRRKSGPSALPS
jgi:ubiquinone/menaquinone biosynthesis C-methylase UbiE